MSPRNELAAAALTWWKTHRPRSFTEADHLKSPWINLSHPAEKRLAKAVARALLDEKERP